MLDALPMNEPVLQIRLKKQLSGGRVPHLLQEGVHENKSKKYCEQIWTQQQYHKFHSHVVHSEICMLLGMRFCSCTKETVGVVVLVLAVPHPIIKPLTFHLLHTASTVGMEKVCRRRRQETDRLLLPTKPSQLTGVTHMHTHTDFSVHR